MIGRRLRRAVKHSGTKIEQESKATTAREYCRHPSVHTLLNAEKWQKKISNILLRTHKHTIVDVSV